MSILPGHIWALIPIWLRAGSIAAVVTLALPAPAAASTQINLSDASQVQWAITGSRAYLRNLNSFDPEWVAGDTNYWFDLSTETGRAMFSAFLSARHARAPLKLWKGAPGTPGQIDQIGEW